MYSSLPILLGLECHSPQAVDLNWRVNGTGLNQLNSKPGEIVTGFTFLGDGMGGSANTAVLNITALSGYNSTEVRCRAFLPNGTLELSSPVNLTVQGDIKCAWSTMWLAYYFITRRNLIYVIYTGPIDGPVNTEYQFRSHSKNSSLLGASIFS